jgi:hypothetical protein
MREKGTPSARPVSRQQMQEKFPDKPLPAKKGGGRVIRALSDIMKRGNFFRGTF